ncbi:hypothetical protein Pmani_013737 [Petrolisthes manimaculis]|uniref:Mitochondrial basic amino acids transporter n=1 Tax=Petrolisthes manimaculis TaxID=1843537 RepID=A0AAE1PV12_9EUCA|nr:hypothetical protein Pmani_013737 [Petrolisthes manimaculis]
MALEFIAGCLGGCAGVVIGHPLDTVKVRLQTQDVNNPKFRGTWHCLTETAKKESVRGLYKGMSSPMAGVAFVNAIIFGVHGNMSKHMKEPDSIKSQVLCGSAAGLCQSIVASPMELVKTRLQLQTESCGTAMKSLSTAASSSSTITNSKTYTSPLDCMKKIITTEGWRGMFRGQAITTLRDVPGFASYFMTYEYLSRSWSGSDGNISPMVVLMAGGFAGSVSWMFSYPLDVVKSRLQADGIGGTSKYKGTLDCLKKSIQSDGVGVLFRGINSSLIRAFPTNAATFAVVTWTMKLFQSQEYNDDWQQSWKEVLRCGEGLVQAASVPSTLQLALTQHYQYYKAVSFLPQVMAASNITTEELELEDNNSEEVNEAQSHKICNCVKETFGFFPLKDKIPNMFGSVYNRNNGFESHTLHSHLCTRPCPWTLTKHQHNLSIVL